jgi:hypothetical protein
MLRHFSRKAMDAWAGRAAVKNQVQSLKAQTKSFPSTVPPIRAFLLNVRCTREARRGAGRTSPTATPTATPHGFPTEKTSMDRGIHLASAPSSAILTAHFGFGGGPQLMARMGRVSIRVEKKVWKKVREHAAREGVPPAEFYRRIFEWGFDQYSHVGELATLRKTGVAGEKQKSVRKGKEAAA